MKSVPGTSASHPFIDQVIGTTRKECLARPSFFNGIDLQRKLDGFQKYCSDHRGHSFLNMKTPQMMAMESAGEKKVASIDDYRWKSHCNGLYELPVAA